MKAVIGVRWYVYVWRRYVYDRSTSEVGSDSDMADFEDATEHAKTAEETHVGANYL